MIIYEICLTNNSENTIKYWHIKDPNCTEIKAREMLLKLVLEAQDEIAQIPVSTLCEIKHDESPEVYHGVIAYSDFHLEFSLHAYTEHQFLERIAADDTFVIGELLLEEGVLN